MWNTYIPEEQYQKIPKEEWDIRDTIPQLAYLSHNFLRYYGKYIPPIAKNLIKKYTKKGGLVLDNFVGCGTTLVEAKLHGRHAVGAEVNPLGVLASKVKTTMINTEELACMSRKLLKKIACDISRLKMKNRPQKAMTDFFSEVDTVDMVDNAQVIKKEVDQPLPFSMPTKFPDINKWFLKEQKDHLGIVRHHIFDLEDGHIKDFFKLAFGAIIRRCSLAFDGEVRPHINKKKKPRQVIAALKDKTKDMIARMKQFARQASNNTTIEVHEVDSRYFREAMMHKTTIINEHPVDLIISHPPYLNAFDYAPVFKLTALWLGLDYKETKTKEIRAWPATNQDLVDTYFKNLKTCFNEMFEVIRPDGVFCIVIGDCTIRQQPLSTHKVFLTMAAEIGFEIEKIIIRKPYYTTGRYSYAPRALKKERILIFRAP